MDKSDVLSLLVAICALVLTLYQIHATRRHNRLSVRPHIRFGWTAGSSGDGIWIKNDGLGPALIEEFELRIKGNVVTLKSVQDRLLEKGMSARINIPSKGSTILDKDTRWLIQSHELLQFKEEQDIFWGEVSAIEIKIKYKSFYERFEPVVLWAVPNPIDGLVTAKPSCSVPL
jgi:hypothetical protein